MNCENAYSLSLKFLHTKLALTGWPDTKYGKLPAPMLAYNLNF